MLRLEDRNISSGQTYEDLQAVNVVSVSNSSKSVTAALSKIMHHIDNFFIVRHTF